MWLKIVILVLFLAVLASLTSGLTFLLKDIGVARPRRTLYALGIRVILASVMMLCIFYGLYSGLLTSQAPWDSHFGG